MSESNVFLKIKMAQTLDRSQQNGTEQVGNPRIPDGCSVDYAITTHIISWHHAVIQGANMSFFAGVIEPFYKANQP